MIAREREQARRRRDLLAMFREGEEAEEEENEADEEEEAQEQRVGRQDGDWDDDGGLPHNHQGTDDSVN
jgi:hypothetical protein